MVLQAMANVTGDDAKGQVVRAGAMIILLGGLVPPNVACEGRVHLSPFEEYLRVPCGVDVKLGVTFRDKVEVPRGEGQFRALNGTWVAGWHAGRRDCGVLFRECLVVSPSGVRRVLVWRLWGWPFSSVCERAEERQATLWGWRRVR